MEVDEQNTTRPMAAARAWQGRAGDPPSAAAAQLFGSRLAVTSTSEEDTAGEVRVGAFLASRNEVRHLIASASLAAAPPPSTSAAPKAEAFGAVSAKPLVVSHGHRAEVQHLTFTRTTDGDGWLGSTDAKGTAVVCRFSYPLTTHDEASVFSPTQTIYLAPPSPVVDWGWSGLAFKPTKPTSLARINHFARSLEWFDEDRCVRKVNTLSCPTQVAYVPGQEDLLAVTEGNDLALWDLRTSERNGCTRRITVVGGPLHGLACGEGKNHGSIAVGGAGRSVTLIDTRRWTPRTRATNLTKYEAPHAHSSTDGRCEISSVHLSEIAEGVCYAGGVDSEVVCRNVNNAKGPRKEEKTEKVHGGGHYDGFRGDGRWVGLQSTRHSFGEALVGHTELGSLYLLLQPQLLVP